MILVKPTESHLPGYRAALERQWSLSMAKWRSPLVARKSPRPA